MSFARQLGAVCGTDLAHVVPITEFRSTGGSGTCRFIEETIAALHVTDLISDEPLTHWTLGAFCVGEEQWTFSGAARELDVPHAVYIWFAGRSGRVLELTLRAALLVSWGPETHRILGAVAHDALEVLGRGLAGTISRWILFVVVQSTGLAASSVVDIPDAKGVTTARGAGGVLKRTCAATLWRCGLVRAESRACEPLAS